MKSFVFSCFLVAVVLVSNSVQYPAEDEQLRTVTVEETTTTGERRNVSIPPLIDWI